MSGERPRIHSGGAGLLFAVVRTQAVLDPNHTGYAIAGVLFAAVGLAAAVWGNAVVFRWRSSVGDGTALIK